MSAEPHYQARRRPRAKRRAEGANLAGSQLAYAPESAAEPQALSLAGLQLGSPPAVLALQRVRGNQSVQRFLGRQAPLPSPALHQIARKSPSDPTAPDTVRVGASGPAVEELQQHLNRHGASPALKSDGAFGPKTQAAVTAFQKTHTDLEGKPLDPDGVVGPKTWRALQQSGQIAGPGPGATQPPGVELRAILAKGDAMSGAEAKQAKDLLFQLKGDEFRSTLKELVTSGAFVQMLLKLDFGEALSTLTSLRTEVVIPTVLLKPATDTIDDDFKRANEIYGPHNIEIEKGNQIELSEKATKKLLSGDTSLDEFTTDQATAEELKLVEMNRMKNRMTGYWVPNMTSSRGETLTQDHLKNLGDDRTAVVVNTANRAQDTFAHEVGHALGLDHEDSDANNLMASGNVRNITGAGIDKLSDAQLAIIRNSLFAEIGKKGVGE
jgi:hypothetical protein